MGSGSEGEGCDKFCGEGAAAEGSSGSGRLTGALDFAISGLEEATAALLCCGGVAGSGGGGRLGTRGMSWERGADVGCRMVEPGAGWLLTLGGGGLCGGGGLAGGPAGLLRDSLVCFPKLCQSRPSP